MERFEYHSVGVLTLDGVQEELRKRAAEGWRCVAAYFYGDKKRHVLILERPVQNP